MIENVEKVPIEKIRESKSNPRKTFAPPDEKELNESIKSSGIVTPLILREVHDQGEVPYEIVDGARRFRAAKSLGIPTVPAIVRVYTAEEAYEVQLISFAQRVDIHPLDEAAAYDQLRKKKFDIAQISAKVGKERSYIARRLQLVSLIEPAKKQLRENKITLGHAIEIARLPQESQKDALDEAEYNSNLKEFHEEIEWRFLPKLDGGKFKKDDATLIPKAGACTVCPKRSGNNLDLFGDLSKKGDHCLDPKCFNAKKKAFEELQKTKEKEKQEENGLSSSKAPASMAHRQELYKRRLEIFENRIEQEARYRQFELLIKRLKWPIDREDFELIAHQLRRHSNFDYGELAKLIGAKETEFITDTNRELKDYGKYTDQQLAQFAIGALLYQELIDDPLMRREEDVRLGRLCAHHGIDRTKVRAGVSTEMAPKKPKPPKVEKPAKVKKSVKKQTAKRKAKK
jgi:ParB/RepB/Spo0J family partition protein